MRRIAPSPHCTLTTLPPLSHECSIDGVGLAGIETWCAFRLSAL